MAVGFGIVMVAVFDLDKHGVAIVGHLPRGLPSIGVPNAPVSDYVKLLSSGIGIMLVGSPRGSAPPGPTPADKAGG